MDTKLRNIKYSAGIKLLAVIVCILGTLTMSYGLLKASYFESALGQDEYLGSSSNSRILNQYYDYAYRSLFYYKSEENIKSANALANELQNYQKQLRDTTNQSIADISSRYSHWIQSAKASANDAEITRLESERDNLIKDEQSRMEKDLEEWKQREIKSQLKDFRSIQEELSRADGIYYYALSPDDTVLSNIGNQGDVQAFFKSLPVYMSDEGLSINQTYARSSERTRIISFYGYDLPDKGQLYTGMSQERFQQEMKTYNDNKSVGLTGFYQAIAGLVLFLIGLCYLLYSAGRRHGTEGVHLLLIDRLYLDVGLCIIIGIIALCGGLMSEISQDLYPQSPDLPYYILGSLLIVSATLLTLLYLSMVAKRFKRREFLRSNLLYAIPAYFFRLFRNFYSLIKRLVSAGTLNVRTALMFLTYASATTVSIIITAAFAVSGNEGGVLFGIPLVAGINIAAFIYVLKKAQALNDITEGVQRLRAGNFSSHIHGSGGDEMVNLAESINHVAEGLKAAVDNEVKAERLKAELVTNVSHDLKTPLTSLITYIDLLKTEGFQSENAERYLGILEQKTNRLKTLTEDLFEAAKAASGSISVSLEQLDAGALLMQGMGELTDKINASGLEFKINIPEEKVLVRADGRLLWRVVENLLSNVFKYALSGSRVYIDVVKDAGKADIVVKNISAYELNISPDELTERFKRGDQSRNSEGSGLGLSIAKSLTELQGGTFKINIDGDLFKATVTLPA